MGKLHPPATAAAGVEEALRRIEGRWKLILLFHLFDGKVQRYSDFEKLSNAKVRSLVEEHLSQCAATLLPAMYMLSHGQDACLVRSTPQ